MPEAMNPPLIATLIFLRDRYLILEFLWKNSVSAMFYAVFFILGVKKPMKTGFFVTLCHSGGRFTGSETCCCAWDNDSGDRIRELRSL
jgi:hypothetical protein